MRIYIEASSFYGQRSGVGRYGMCITEALITQRKDDEFVLFNFLRPGRRLQLDFDLPQNAHIKHIRWFPGRLFSLLMRNGISLPLELFGLGRADVLLFPNFIAWSSLSNKKRISVVHDIAFEFFPGYIQAKNLAYLRAQARKSLKRSARIIAVSEATKRDIAKHYDMPQDKIAVVHNAVDHATFNPGAKRRTAETLQKLKLPEKYFLFVGNIEPRKNLLGLLKAYNESYKSHQAALVIVGGGKWSWNSDAFHELVDKLSDLPIYRTGFIDDTDMAALYAGAIAFVYPSFYEGFGIPCLEAMAVGCPVICSNTSSFPELVGNAAVQVDPHDTNAIARAMTRMFRDAQLRKRLNTIEKGRAKRYSWAESAAVLSRIIDEAAAEQ